MAIQHIRRFRLRIRVDKTRAENAKRQARIRKQARKFFSEVVFEGEATRERR